jgi:hypothetical protein
MSKNSDEEKTPKKRRRYPIIPLEGPATVELSLEERFEILQNIFKYQFFATNRRIGEQFGYEAANKMVAEVSDEATPLLAEGYRKKFDLKGKGAALVSQVIQVEFQGEGSDAAVISETEDEAELDIDCMMGDMLQNPKFSSIPITEGLCEGGCRIWADDIAKTVEPDLKADRLTWMGDGAPRCRFRIWRESQENAGDSES